jgi:predicted small integral membrane protein
MRYTQNGFVEDIKWRSKRKSSWLSSLAGYTICFVSGITALLVIVGGIVVLQAIVDAIQKIFP